MIRNIVFDIGNVLVRFRPEEHLRAYVQSNPEAVALRDMIYLSKPWKDGDRGLLGRGAVTERICSEHPEHAALLREVLPVCSEWLTMPDALPGFLDALRGAGYSLYCISNTNDADWASVSSRYPAIAGLPGVLSFRDRVMKPGPEPFQLLIRRFSLLAEECLFIDDMPENTRAAGNVGFQTLLLSSGCESLPGVLGANAEIGGRLR